ncbi:MAG: hypothetical protein ACE5F1_03105 [Planctomycetota bacterium]
MSIGTRNRRILRVSFLVVGSLCLLMLVQWSRSRAHDLQDYRFDPKRVDLGELCPGWFAAPMARAFFRAYEEQAGLPFSLLDDAAVDGFAGRVRALAWVRSLELVRQLPNRMTLDLELERPAAVAPPLRGRLDLVSASGVLLPLDPQRPLEKVLDHGFGLPAPGSPIGAWPAPFGLPLLLGVPEHDAARRGACLAAGASVAARVQDGCWPRARAMLRERGKDPWMPRLLGVDVSNTRMQLIRRPDSAEIRLVVASRDQHVVYLDWGHSPGGRFVEIPGGTKARVLILLLEKHPGLEDVAAADLRFSNRWQDRIVPLAGR